MKHFISLISSNFFLSTQLEKIKDTNINKNKNKHERIRTTKLLHRHCWVYKIRARDSLIDRLPAIVYTTMEIVSLFYHRKVILNHIANSIRNHSNFFSSVLRRWFAYTMQSNIQCHFGCWFCNVSRFYTICLYTLHLHCFSHSVSFCTNSMLYFRSTFHFKLKVEKNMEIMTLS